MGISNPISTGAWRKLTTVTVPGGNPSSVTIASGVDYSAYKRIVLVLDLKFTAASMTDYGIQFNNDNAANYIGTSWDYSTPAVGVSTAFGAATFCFVASAVTASGALNGEIWFNPNRDLSNNIGVEMHVYGGNLVYYGSKASYAAAAAVTTIKLVQSGSLTFDAGGTITVYGIEG